MTTERPKHGIYLFMPEEQYHAVDALSKSLIKKALICPRDAWEAIHGDGQEETIDMVFGSGMHKLILEGREAFESKYVRGFDKSEFPDALDTIEDFKRWFAKREEKAPTGSKSKLIEAALAIDSGVEIIEVLKVHHSAGIVGKTELPPAKYDEIMRRANLFEKWQWGDTESRQTEVSFFWYDESLKCECKARLDLVQFFSDCGKIWDIKTFTNKNRKPIQRAVNDAINYERYYIDASFYTRALRATPVEFHDAAAPPAWTVPKDLSFHLLFIEKGSAFPNIVPKEIVLSQFGTLNEIGLAADAAIRTAAAEINEFRQGDCSTPWQTIHQSSEFNEENLNMYIL